LSSRLTISQVFNPLPWIPILAFLAVTQSIKLGIILSQPNSVDFKYWFYQCFQYPPYSFHCVTVHGDLFPMAYSLLWYAVYVPLTAHGYWFTNFTLLAADTITGVIIARKYSQLFFAIWTQGSLYFLLASPQDFLIWTMILAGKHRRYGPAFLVLAVLTKLPLIPPIFDPAIWGYIAYNPYSLHDPNNWARYTLIGSYWLLTLGTWVYKRGLLQKHVNSPYITPATPVARTDNGKSTRNPRSASGHRDRTSPRLDSSNINIHSIHRTRTIQWSAIARHHRTTDLRSNHTLRGNRPHPRRKEHGLRHEGSTPKPTIQKTPKLARLRIRRIAVPSSLFLILLVLLTPVTQVWASNYVGYNTANCGAGCPGSGIPACNVTPCSTSGGVGQILIAPLTGTLQSVSFYTASVSLPTQVVILTAPSLSKQASGNCVFAVGTCGKESAGDIFTIVDVENLGGLSTNTFTTVLLAGTVPVTINQYVAIVLVQAGSNGAVQIDTACPCSGTVYTTYMFFNTAPNNGCIGGNGAAVIGNQACTDNTNNSAQPIVGGTFVPTSTPVQTFSTCYGNCGSPAVTLANTNSTHLTNFNNSITLFYQFQSNVNGFVTNITTSLATNYNNGEQVQIALYTTDPSCTLANNPFTAQCPGFLAANSPFVQNPAKGKLNQNINVQAKNGQWFGVSVTGLFKGLDLNDTNTNVILYQTNGQNPGLINTYSSLGNSKLGLYAFITGNVVINAPPITGAGCNTVSCGLQAFWIALGGDLPAAIIAFFVFFLFLAGFLFWMGRHSPIMLALIPAFLLIFGVLLLIMFSGAGILPPYIPVLIIIAVAWVFATPLIWRSRHHSGEAA
jgi:hypothetical protein